MKLDDYLVTKGNASFEELLNGAQEICLDIVSRIDFIRKSDGYRFEICRGIAKDVISDMNKKGYFIHSPLEPLYFLSKTKSVLSFGDKRFIAFIDETYGINQSESIWKYLKAALETETIMRGNRVEVRKFVFYDVLRDVLYISNFSGSMYFLDGTQVRLVDNGTDGVLFVDPEGWESYKYLGQQIQSGYLWELLIDPVNFHVAPDSLLTISELRILWLLYIYCLFFEELLPTKPLLLFLGEKGSGKTSALVWLLILLFGKDAKVISLMKSKEDAFIATITNSYLVVLDNVDGRIEWLNDHLASIATGGTIALRELYKTNNLIQYKLRVFTALTSRTPKFKRDDVVDRLLIFPMQRLTSFRSEGAFRKKILANRDFLITELINDLNVVVKILKENKEEFEGVHRMADFAAFGWRIFKGLGVDQHFLSILEKMTQKQSEFLLEGDSLYDALVIWMDIESNRNRPLLAVELFKELKKTAENNQITWTYVEAKSFGKRLNNIAPNLAKFFKVTIKERGGNKRAYAFDIIN